jgi:hypothetical protein
MLWCQPRHAGAAPLGMMLEVPGLGWRRRQADLAMSSCWSSVSPRLELLYLPRLINLAIRANMYTFEPLVGSRSSAIPRGPPTLPATTATPDTPRSITGAGVGVACHAMIAGSPATRCGSQCSLALGVLRLACRPSRTASAEAGSVRWSILLRRVGRPQPRRPR